MHIFTHAADALSDYLHAKIKTKNKWEIKRNSNNVYVDYKYIMYLT